MSLAKFLEKLFYDMIPTIHTHTHTHTHARTYTHAHTHTRTHTHTHTHTQAAIMEITAGLPLSSQQEVGRERVSEFAFRVLNESCTTVTNTSAKTAVQLIFGKANLVSVVFISFGNRLFR